MIGLRKSKVAATIHGIRTHGKWQKTITPHLAKYGLIPYHIDYGFFHALALIIPPIRERRIEKVRAELRNLKITARLDRISIIAHSFGTYIAMEVLKREEGELLYDRVVLTGSILPCDFDWKSLLSKKWVIAVRNERATSDWVVCVADLVSRWLPTFSRLKAGRSGRNAFTQKHAMLLDYSTGGGHSETHNSGKFDHWAEFISYPHLSEDALGTITTEMQALRQEAASILAQPPDSIRINLFAPIDGVLQIVPGAFDNMTFAPEFQLKIKRGHGATGIAFATGDPCVAEKIGTSWSVGHLPGDELEKLEPRLKWVLSLPVVSPIRGVVVGVVNIDGLNEIPKRLADSKNPDFEATLVAFRGGMIRRFIEPLEAAFRGDRQERIED